MLIHKKVNSERIALGTRKRITLDLAFLPARKYSGDDPPSGGNMNLECRREFYQRSQVKGIDFRVHCLKSANCNTVMEKVTSQRP